MLCRIIKREEMAVDEAGDGAEAIELIDADGYGVILLDLMMPRVDGFAVLEYMRAHHPAELSRTIVASAVPLEEIQRRVDVPVRIHTKPFDLPRLLTQIRECVAASSSV